MWNVESKTPNYEEYRGCEVWRSGVRCGEVGWGVAKRGEVWWSGVRCGEVRWGVAKCGEVWQSGVRRGEVGRGVAKRGEVWRSWVRCGEAGWGECDYRYSCVVIVLKVSVLASNKGCEVRGEGWVKVKICVWEWNEILVIRCVYLKSIYPCLIAINFRYTCFRKVSIES